MGSSLPVHIQRYRIEYADRREWGFEAVRNDWFPDWLGNCESSDGCIMNNVQAQTQSCTSIVLQSAAEGALTGMQSVVETLRMTFENNRDIIMQELRSFTDIRTVKPDGTFYVLPDFRAYSQNSDRAVSISVEKGSGCHGSR